MERIHQDTMINLISYSCTTTSDSFALLNSCFYKDTCWYLLRDYLYLFIPIFDYFELVLFPIVLH